MTRFFAHLCLFLQLIDIQVSPFATQIILEAYLRVLENAGQRELIAMYAGALGDNAVERYALFLTSLELAGDATERRLALTRAREHGLDIERVAIVTAERTIEKTFTVGRCHSLQKRRQKRIGAETRRVGQILPPAKGPLPSIMGLEPAPTDAEILLLRSIEWTTFLESTYDTALEQANVILRYFLGAYRRFASFSLTDSSIAHGCGIWVPQAAGGSSCRRRYWTCSRRSSGAWWSPRTRRRNTCTIASSSTCGSCSRASWRRRRSSSRR